MNLHRPLHGQVKILGRNDPINLTPTGPHSVPMILRELLVILADGQIQFRGELTIKITQHPAAADDSIESQIDSSAMLANASKSHSVDPMDSEPEADYRQRLAESGEDENVIDTLVSIHYPDEIDREWFNNTLLIRYRTTPWTDLSADDRRRIHNIMESDFRGTKYYPESPPWQ